MRKKAQQTCLTEVVLPGMGEVSEMGTQRFRRLRGCVSEVQEPGVCSGGGPKWMEWL